MAVSPGLVKYVLPDLESDQKLQNSAFSVYYAIRHAYGSTPAVRSIENHTGRAFIMQYAIAQLANPPAARAPRSQADQGTAQPPK